MAVTTSRLIYRNKTYEEIVAEEAEKERLRRVPAPASWVTKEHLMLWHKIVKESERKLHPTHLILPYFEFIFGQPTEEKGLEQIGSLTDLMFQEPGWLFECEDDSVKERLSYILRKIRKMGYSCNFYDQLTPERRYGAYERWIGDLFGGLR